MKRVLIIIAAAILLTLSMSVLSYATADNSFIERLDEKGRTTIKIISTKGIWTDDGIGTRFISVDGHQFIDEWLYFTDTKTYPDKRKGGYCFDANGYLIKNTFFDSNGKRYYAEVDGRKAKGFFKVNGILYYAGTSDTSRGYVYMAPEEKTILKDGVKYTIDETGRITYPAGSPDPTLPKESVSSAGQTSSENGWVKNGTKWNYLVNGTPVKQNWIQDQNSWYYMDENGDMVHNEVRQINGIWYKFDSKGVMLSNTTVTYQGRKYTIDQSGAMRQETDDVITESIARANKKYNKYLNNSTVQWMNATYAIYTLSQNKNIKAFGGWINLDGTGPDQTTAASYGPLMAQQWGVVNRTSADAVLNALLESGRETGSAWDYSRAMSNIGLYYQCCYYSETEALDKALEVAKEIQTRFSSWDEFNASYLAGYSQWSGQSREVYLNRLKASAYNPFSIDWNTPLTKSW